MLRIKESGNWDKTTKYLQTDFDAILLKSLEKYGDLGVASLAANTPNATGETAGSWYYKITKTKSQYSIAWYNSHMAGQTPLVILLQYGHGTRNGGYVQGIDFINPAIRPVMAKIADDAWKEIKRV